LADPAAYEPPLLRFTDSFPINYALTAAILALAATGLAHLLSLATPRPRVFFNWIVGLITVVPFALEGSLKGKICAAVINMVIGICIASLLSAVLSRTVVDAERSWQQP
jgi:hypothetical protein